MRRRATSGCPGKARTRRSTTAIDRGAAAPRPMSLKSKLLSPDGFVLLYGTTPPRSGSPADLIHGAAAKLAERVRGLPLDGFVVYDLQDETARTPVPRPFPFTPTVDSRGYSKLLGELTGRPVVCYKCI